ncbi:MAG: DUF1611 domain-containing protein [Gemmatimonadota bacterium]
MTAPHFTILAEGQFGVESAKTASSAIRYVPERISSVLDSEVAGSTVERVIGYGGAIPIFSTLSEALEGDRRPDALLIGIAPQGGALPAAWRPVLRQALDAGLDIWSGLHVHLSDDDDLAGRAAANGVRLVDLRKPPDDLVVATGRAQETTAFRVLTVGSDCNVGKMTTALELRRELEARGVATGFGATGQTGILLEGSGIAVDAVVSDFISGATERLTLEAARDADVVLIEGQGSLMHPGYSGVTLGLLQGSLPQAMILCAMPSRPTIFGGHHDWVRLPALDEVARRYEDALGWACPDVPGKIVAVSLATYDIGEEEALRAVEDAERVTGLPATDPVRFGAALLADAVESRRAELAASRTPAAS